jgi:hypothetical protein
MSGHENVRIMGPCIRALCETARDPGHFTKVNGNPGLISGNALNRIPKRFYSMSTNRVISEQTKELFTAAESGDADKVRLLMNDKNVDINWKKHEAVRWSILGRFTLSM